MSTDDSSGDTETYAGTGERQHIKLQPPTSSVSATAGNKLQQPNNVPLILMRHVPADDNTNQQTTKIYTTRNHPQQGPTSQFPPGFQNPSAVPYPPNTNPNGQRLGGSISTTPRNNAPDDSDPPPPNGTAKGTIPTEVRHMKTPREIMKGLNEYVIGQRNVKIALSVGVYNHYKRIFVAEAYQQNGPNNTGGTEHQYQHVDASGLMMDSTSTSLGNLKLGQFGSSYTVPPSSTSTAQRMVPQQPTTTTTTTSTSQQNHYYVDGKTGTSTPQTPSQPKSSYCETPGADEINTNSIDNPSFGRDIEDCEIEKSNIMLLGPTGSGKVRCLFVVVFLIVLQCIHQA
jgi:hypothetical protein